jgi:Putative Actinobacterial Holin-X, holin superfamily III
MATAATEITTSADVRNEQEPSNAPLVDLVGRLASNLRVLLLEETTLAKREFAEKAERAKTPLLALLLGALTVAGGVLVLLAAAVLALSLVLAPWFAALLIGGGVSAAGVLLLLLGKSKLSRLSLTPELTLARVRGDVNAIKDAMS